MKGWDFKSGFLCTTATNANRILRRRSPFPPFFRFRRRPRGGEERKSHGRKKGFSTRASGAKARGEAFMCSIFPPSVLHFKAEGASAAMFRRRRRGFFSLCTSGNVSSICTLSSSQNRISSFPRQSRHGAGYWLRPFSAEGRNGLSSFITVLYTAHAGAETQQISSAKNAKRKFSRDHFFFLAFVIAVLYGLHVQQTSLGLYIFFAHHHRSKILPLRETDGGRRRRR